MDRKWIVLAALAALTLVIGCTSAPPPPPPAPPPAVAEAPPTVEVESQPRMEEPVDETPAEVPKSVQAWMDEATASGLLGDVFYDFDKYDLRGDARERLAKNAEFMKGDGASLTFTVEGHCDERGTNEYNLALGQQRAQSAVDYLVSLGVSGGRFEPISYGEEKPFCRESSEACWQQNRRARFVVNGVAN